MAGRVFAVSIAWAPVALTVVYFFSRAPVLAEDTNPESVLVVGTAPADTLTLQVQNRSPVSITPTELLQEAAPSALISDTESNSFQEDLYFHGFDASPVLGTPEGLAIYQGGTRINQRFGDTVLWDVIPTFAIRTVTVVPGSDPLFGLNALGGAVALGMKSGFDAPEGEAIDAAAGSFGRARLVAEIAKQFGDEAIYLGASAVDDSGWRRSSNSTVYQAYGDFAVRSTRGNAGLSLSLATDSLNENGAVPVQDSRIAAFAIPDTARNQDALMQARDASDWGDGMSFRSSAYLRATHIATANGEASGFSACPFNPALLCDSDGMQLNTIGGAPIASSVGGAGTDGIETISTTAAGGIAEVDWSRRLFGNDNTAILGEAFDYARTGFGSATRLGNLTFQPGGTTTVPLDILLGGPQWNIHLQSQNLDEGVYAQDEVALTQAVSVELSGRFHYDEIGISDRRGSALTGNHEYLGFNPGIEVTWKAGEEFAAYAEFEQSNRTPTAAELSCANQSAPCLFPLSFISDPGLKQVIARTAEAGAKGRIDLEGMSLNWSADVFGTRNADDILFESSGPFIGSGFFANTGTTQRVGFDIAMDAEWRQFYMRFSYAYVNATFESAFVDLSPANPGSDADGDIFVRLGDRIPSIPHSIAKLNVGYQPAPGLHLSVGGIFVSSQYLRGDEANLQPQLPGYFVINADAEISVRSDLQIYIQGENILGRQYASFGLFGDPSGNGAFPQFSNPRFIVPAQPFAIWAGLRKQF